MTSLLIMGFGDDSKSYKESTRQYIKVLSFCKLQTLSLVFIKSKFIADHCLKVSRMIGDELRFNENRL